MITLYDIAAKNGIKTWSPNPWKTRYVLNYKKIPYQTITVEYPDLESEFKKLGIPPSGTKTDGTALYTSPSIIDESTKTPITDSYKIAEYLDKAYPSTPPVLPPGTEALQAAFYEQFGQLMGLVRPLLLPRFPVDVLNPISAEYFTRTRTQAFGKPLADVEPQGEARVEAWKQVERTFDKLNGWLSRSSGRFFMGETITFADITVASMLSALKVCFGQDSKEWKNIETWNDGRWKALLTDLEPYASVEN